MTKSTMKMTDEDDQWWGRLWECHLDDNHERGLGKIFGWGWGEQNDEDDYENVIQMSESPTLPGWYNTSISLADRCKLPKVCSNANCKTKMDSNLKVEQEGGGCNAKSAQFMEEGGQVDAKRQKRIQMQLQIQIQIYVKIQTQLRATNHNSCPTISVLLIGKICSPISSFLSPVLWLGRPGLWPQYCHFQRCWGLSTHLQQV